MWNKNLLKFRVSGFLKKILFCMVCFILFLIALSLLVLGSARSKNASAKYSISKYNVKINDIVFNDTNGGGPKIKVYISKENAVKEMFLEEYVRGVVSAEMPATFEVEALKSQAVAARTYALSHMAQFNGTRCKNANGADICDTVHCQVYKSKEERLNSWSESSRGEYWNKVTEAVSSTTGEVLTYVGSLVQEPYYFAISSGKTESGLEVFASNAPYLKSVDSPGEEKVQKYKSTVKFGYAELAGIINKKYPKAGVTTKQIKNQVSVIKRTKETGSVSQIRIGNITISGVEARRLFSLNSTNFTIKFNTKETEFNCTGYGHGVGMSQWGANAMAKSGKKYNEILLHYYQGVKVEKIKNI